MDRSNREVQALLDALDNMLVITQERLKPFLDNGFIHTDRQPKKNIGTTDAIQAMDSTTRKKVKEYKQQLFRCINKSKAHEIENILFDITDQKDTIESNKVYQELQNIIIHAQICLQKYHEWKNLTQLKQEERARRLYLEAIEQDKINKLIS